jgi:hypothetical protein
MCNREKKKEREEATRTAIWSHNRARLKKKLETYKTTARAKIAFRIEINSYCVYVCVCVSVSLCLSGGHETAEKTPMKDKTQKHDHNQNRKKNMISIIEINLKCLRLSRS